MNTIKPGWKTTEFWFSLVAAGTLALLGKLNLGLDTAGVNPIFSSLGHWVIPLAIAWITARYGDNRANIKSASIAAGSAAASNPLPILNK